MLEDAIAAVAAAPKSSKGGWPEHDATSISSVAGLLLEDDEEEVVDPTAEQRDPDYARIAHLLDLGLEHDALRHVIRTTRFGERSPAHALMAGVPALS